MITCHRKYLEERCLKRGLGLADAMPCVVSMNGDMWTINVDHDSYPRGVGALSFECVPDCTTPDFVCLPGYCCIENIFDGSNSCLPCPSSSSSSAESSSSSSSGPCNIGGLTNSNAIKCCRYEDQYGCYTSTLGSICDDCQPGTGGRTLVADQISDINIPCFDWESCDVISSSSSSSSSGSSSSSSSSSSSANCPPGYQFCPEGPEWPSRCHPENSPCMSYVCSDGQCREAPNIGLGWETIADCESRCGA